MYKSVNKKQTFTWLLTLFLITVSGVSSADCYEKAGAYYSVNPWLLKAIASVESNENPEAQNINRQFKGLNEDIGMMQINSIWLPQLAKFGISREALFNPCLNVHIGAWILAQQMQTYGNSWTAVGAYHSRTPDKNLWYADKVHKRLKAWGKL